jgi:hypothetical protein
MMKAIVQKKAPSHSLAISREIHKKCQREELEWDQGPNF